MYILGMKFWIQDAYMCTRFHERETERAAGKKEGYFFFHPFLCYFSSFFSLVRSLSRFPLDCLLSEQQL